MKIRRGDERVDARRAAPFSDSPGALDVVGPAARQRRDDRPSYPRGDTLDPFGIGVGGNREAGLDQVHAERVELPGQLHLLVRPQREARGLLAVAQGGVEDRDPVWPCADGIVRPG